MPRRARPAGASLCPGIALSSGARLLARGQVMRPGRTLTVCRGDAYALTGEDERHVATILTTMFGVGKA